MDIQTRAAERLSGRRPICLLICATFLVVCLSGLSPTGGARAGSQCRCHSDRIPAPRAHRQPARYLCDLPTPQR